VGRSIGKKHRGVYEYPPGSDVWWIQYFVDGRRRREKIGGKQAAINRCQQRKTEAREGRLPTPQHDVPFDDFVNEYLEGERLRLRAFAEYERHSRVWTDRFGHRPLRRILPRDIQTWATRRRAEVEPATVNRELSFLRRVFSVALANGLVERNPVKAVKFFREPSGRVRFLTDDEEPRLREQLDPSQWQIVEFAFNTGLRQSEQFGLRWEHVNLANRVLTIPRSKHGGARHVPLNDTATAILRALPSRFNSRWVFPNRTGKSPLNATNFRQRVFNPAVRSAGIENLRWHDLRHTFASRLAMKGVDLNSIRELMGHKTLAMTLRYAHLSQSHLHQAVKQLDGGGSSGGSTPEHAGASRGTHSANKSAKS
jgi:site-specific recombinase XerD